MKKIALLAIFCTLLVMGAAHGQQLDAALGFNAVSATSASNASSNYSPQSIGGGLTSNFSADFLLAHNFGVGTEFSWRWSKNQYQIPGLGISVPFRPFFYDFNAIWVPRVTKSLSPELQAGIGAENLHFYVAPSCGTNCQNYVSNNHFMGHFGTGLRYYVAGNLFIRPEAHVYLVRNNNQFSSPYVKRYGVSVGYTFGGRK